MENDIKLKVFESMVIIRSYIIIFKHSKNQNFEKFIMKGKRANGDVLYERWITMYHTILYIVGWDWGMWVLAHILKLAF